jgi:energy-coupling factor transporter ATP-binding protein EcfA2
VPRSNVRSRGKDAIFSILADVKRETDMTVIVVEHNVEQVAPLSDLLVLMYGGRVVRAAPPEEFFQDCDALVERGIQPPQATMFLDRLKRDGRFPGRLSARFEDNVAVVQELLARARCSGSGT